MLTNQLTTITATELERVSGGDNPISRVADKTFEYAGKGGGTGAIVGFGAGRLARFPSDSGNPIEKLPEWIGAGIGGTVGTIVGSAWGFGVGVGNEVNRLIGQQSEL
jgi:hypothetical protein